MSGGREFLEEVLIQMDRWCVGQATKDMKVFNEKIPIMLQALADASAASALESAYHDELTRHQILVRAAILNDRCAHALESLEEKK